MLYSKNLCNSAFPQLKVRDFNRKWGPGGRGAELLELPLSPWAGSYGSYSIVRQGLVLVTLYSSILGLSSFPFSFQLNAQNTHD